MATKDKFPNVATIQVVESAANTLTFKKLETGISLFEKVAWIIHRIEYLVTAGTFTGMASTGDLIEFGLTATDQMASLSVVNAAMIDYQMRLRFDWGANPDVEMMELPWVIDLSTLPMGGIIVPPNPLYLGVKGTGMGVAATLTAKFFYTTYVLAADDYWELVEARRIISS